MVDRVQRRSPWRWQRVLSDLLIIAGVGLLLYPVGTFGYAWWQQRGLARQLVLTHPALTVPSRTYFTEDMVQLKEETNALRKAAAAAERKAELTALSSAAGAFAASLAADPSSGAVPIGRIVIPAIGVDAVLIEGVGRADLREGPGHWPETPLPGLGGNFVVSGHRTTYGAPFFKLDKLAPGDEIDVVLPYAAARYQVTRSVIVLPYQTDVVAQRGVEEISLATCHPIYSARQRLVVQAKMISFKLLDQAGAASAAGG